MQQKIQQALADSPLSNAILAVLEEQEWKGFLPAEKVRSICDEFKLTPVQLGLALLPVAACYSHTPISEFMLARLRLVKVVIFTLVRIKNFRVVAWLKPSMLNKVRLAMPGYAMNLASRISW